MIRRVVGSIALLASFGFGTGAFAQQTLVTNITSYDSLNAPLRNSSLLDTAGGQKYINARAVESGGEGVYSVANTFDDARFSTTNVGNNTISTTLLADDLTLQIATTNTPANSALSSYNITSLGFLLSNRNASAVTVNASVRIYDIDGFGDTIINGINNNGGYAGTLLGAYNLGSVTLASNVDSGAASHYASVTQVSVPSASFSSSPLTLDGSQFQLLGGNYQRTVWVGLFLTADATTTTVAQLNNVGYVSYDPRTSNNLNGVTETFEYGLSNDQLYGDRNLDFNGDGDWDDTYTETRPDGTSVTTFENAALANGGYNAPRIAPDTPDGPGVDVQADRIRSLAQFRNSDGAYPQANLTWLIQGDALYVVTPEPGTIGLALAGGLPLGIALVRRRRTRKTA